MPRPGPKRFLLCGAVLLAAAAVTAVSEASRAQVEAEATELLGRVVGIADGDTLTLLVDRTQFRIRLAQIDAPESGQPYGRAAKRALSALAFGKHARVVVVDTDRYGREVGEVFVDALHVNREMVRAGHAWAYTRYSRSVAIIELEDAARAAKRGLWELPPGQREAPWLWRRGRRTASEGETRPEPAPLGCGNRESCNQMSSCEEARFYFERCGLHRLDGDGDGIPCEKLCRR